MATEKKKSLVIVESPAKAKTISKYLGSDFQVDQHRAYSDLPQGSKEVPRKVQVRAVGLLGVNVDEDFTPIYIVPQDKKKQVSKLQSAVKEAKDLYLATDEDREGEAISALARSFEAQSPCPSLVFHEITRKRSKTL